MRFFPIIVRGPAPGSPRRIGEIVRIAEDLDEACRHVTKQNRRFGETLAIDEEPSLVVTHPEPEEWDGDDWWKGGDA
jgi:hypothetical protein